MVFWRRRKHAESEQGRYAYYAQDLEPLKQQLANLLKVAKSRPVQRAELAPIERSLETLNKRMLDIWHEALRLQQQEELRLQQQEELRLQQKEERERERLRLEALREKYVKQDAAQAIVNQSFSKSTTKKVGKGLLNKLKNLTRWF